MLLLVGCNTSAERLSEVLRQPFSRQDLVDDHREKAQRLEAGNALREALREWQLVKILQPQDDGAEAQIDRLSRKIDSSFRQHLAAAKKATARHQYKTSRSHLLTALALKPGNKTAIALIKANQSQLAYARLDAAPGVAKGKVSEVDVYTAAKARRPSTVAPAVKPTASGKAVTSSPPRNTSGFEQSLALGQTHLSRKEYEAALRQFQKARAAAKEPHPRLDGLIAKTRGALADRHYELGVAAFRTARYGDAAKEFARVLHYEPDHHKARFYLSSAESLRKK